MTSTSRRAAAAIAFIPLVVACSSKPTGTSGGHPAGTGQTGAAVSPQPTADGSAATILAKIPIPGNPGGMLSAYGSIWVVSRHENNVVRVDPRTNVPTATIALGDEPAYLSDDGTAVWVVEFGSSRLARIDPTTNGVTQVALPDSAGSWPVFGAGAIWQATASGLVEVDVRTSKIVNTLAVDSPTGPAFASGLVWLAKPSSGITRLDPATLAVRDSVAAGVNASGVIAFDGNWMWAGGGTTVAQLDPVSGAVVATYSIPYGIDPGLGSASGGRFWLQKPFPDGFAFIDPTSRAISALQELPSAVTSGLFVLATGLHEAYVADWDANTVYRVDPAP